MTLTHKTKFALAIAIFFWASAFVGIRAALLDYSPQGLALLRFLIASVFMSFVYWRLPRKNAISLLDKAKLLAIGVLGIGIYNITLNYGELSVSSGMASFIISQSPLITAVSAILFLGERISLLRFSGFIVSIFGVALISFGEKGGFKWDVGIFYIIVATIAGGFYSVLQKSILKRCHPIEATTYVIWGGTLFLLLYTSQMQQDWQQASWAATAIVAYLGIFPAAAGYIAWSYALSQIPASRAVSFLYFMPFVATGLGWVCLNEVPAPISMIGGIFAILGVWLVNRSSVPHTQTPSLATNTLADATDSSQK